jgi:hypothetical protein
MLASMQRFAIGWLLVLTLPSVLGCTRSHERGPGRDLGADVTPDADVVRCPDGTECTADEECCLGCGTSYICNPTRFMMCPDVDCPTCWPMDATGVGACLAFFGVKWDGDACVGVGGCSCEGTACGALFDDIDDCEAAYAGCL